MTTTDDPIADPLNTEQDAGTSATTPWPGRLARWAPRRLWHLAPIYLACSLAATLTNSPGRWIADARLEYSTNPIDFLFGHGFIWDDGRGLGNTVTLYSPVLAAYQALLQFFGAEPWLIERLVHTALLTIAATGLAGLLSVMRPKVGGVHLLAGLIYAFNPYTSQFLLPSGLFLSYALAPWFLTFYLRGTQDRDAGWRMAAWFALCIFAVGALNPAALVYALLPVPIAAAYLVFVERSMPLRPAITWLVRAGLLSFLVSCGALVVLWFQRDDIALNLATTERPAVIASRSSWAESWRGLGMWVTYFGDSGGQLREQSGAYFRNPLVVVAAYGAPLAAALTLALSRWRPRLYFAALVAVAVPIMVGVWPVDSPSPFGRFMDWGFETAVLVRGLRTTYKAGSAFYLGVAVLAAVGITALLGRTQSESDDPALPRVGRQLAGVGLIAMIVVSAFPFWTGNLYNDDEGFDDIPSYWDDAFDWINSQPDDGRVLVLPGVVRTRYRWGYVNDNLFHGLLDKSLVSHQSIPPPGTPQAADAVLALDEYLASPDYAPGTIGPILRRLGVRWVVFQNDVEWERVGVPRPSHFDPVRNDADLMRVRSFGEVGENTTSGFDPVAGLKGEASMQPIEIFEVRDAQPTIRIASGLPMVVAGAGDAWPQLAQQGRLDGGPVLYTGSTDDDELAAVLADSSPVVITDGSRRRYIQVRTGRVAMSNTLALDEETPREARSVFAETDSQTYATYRDAVSINASRTGGGITPFDPSQRPARAFDAVERTAWEVTGAGAQGAYLAVRLRSKTAVNGVSVLTNVQSGSRAVEVIRVELITADGAVIANEATKGEADADGWITVDVTGDDVVEVQIHLEKLGGPLSAPTAVSEVHVMGVDGPLDLREMLRTPRDLEVSAARSPEIESLLGNADVSYSFRRYIGTGVADEETEIRRIFWAPRARAVDVTGTVRLSTRTPDVTVDSLVAAEVGAFGSERASGVSDGWGVNAVDGDPTTSWLGPPNAGVSLTVRTGSQRLDSIEFVFTILTEEADIRKEFSRVRAATVTASGPAGSITANVLPGNIVCTDRSETLLRCTESFVSDLPPSVYETVEFEPQSFTSSDGTFGPRPLAVSEVIFNADSESVVNTADVGTCVDAFEIDGQTASVRLTGTIEALLESRAVGFESCSAFPLESGEHIFESEPSLSGALSDFLIVDADRTEPAEPVQRSTVEVIERSPTRIILQVTAPKGAYLLGPGAQHVGWTATVDGVPLGDAVARDTISAWRLPAVDQGRVELRFRPQRTYELALAVSAAGLAICLYLVSRVRRS
ncbi:MAG: hypothetical protein ACI9N0_001133 [Ilumatobacter sp.]